jgi:hypothetical protein
MSDQRAEGESVLPPPRRPLGPVVWVAYFTALGAFAGWAGDELVDWRAFLVSGLLGVCVCGADALVRWVRVSRAVGRYSLQLLLILGLLHGLLLGVVFGLIQLLAAVGIAALVEKVAGGAAVTIRVLAGAGFGCLLAVAVAWWSARQSRSPDPGPTDPA